MLEENQHTIVPESFVSGPEGSTNSNFVQLDEIIPCHTGTQETLKEVAEQTPYGEIFLNDLISRQLTLGLAVALTFLATVSVIPLFNLLAPDAAMTPVLGLPLTWLLLGVLIYPLIWGLAFYFVGTSKKYEDDFTRLVK